MSPLFTIGVVIIGNEILSGRRQDKHFDFLLRLTRSRQLSIAYVYYVPDIPDDIEDTLRRCFLKETIPCFCFGGIGNTPDDHTRAAAARAADVSLTFHESAYAELRARFPDAALTPQRKRFAELPEGADIVLNPLNRIPGFRVRNITFLPGFPEMAHPMVIQELDHHYYHHYHPDYVQYIFSILNAHESALLPLMESIESSFDVQISSLPALQPLRIEFGIHGPKESVHAAYLNMTEALIKDDYQFIALQVE